MRLIDADALLEKMKCTDRYFMIKFDIEKAPTVDPWHYPSRGEYPPNDEEVLCLLLSGSSYVGFWDKEDKSWNFFEFYEEEIKCWQYIVPPEEGV